MITQAFRALTSSVSVTAAEDLAPHIDALTASYERSSGPYDLHYRLDRCALWRNDICVRETETTLDLVPAFELDLYRSIVEIHIEAGWLLHAAALALDCCTLLLAGASGAGKSTLAAALVAHGASYLSDECVLLTPQGAVHGLRRPIAFEAPPEHLALNAPFTRMTYPLRWQLDGTLQHPTLLHPPPLQLAAQPSTLGILLLLKRSKPPAGLRRLAPAEALCALWPHSLGTSRPALTAASALVSSYPVFELELGRLDETRDLLCRLAAAPQAQTLT